MMISVILNADFVHTVQKSTTSAAFSGWTRNKAKEEEDNPTSVFANE
jgi:hypothetical protein